MSNPFREAYYKERAREIRLRGVSRDPSIGEDRRRKLDDEEGYHAETESLNERKFSSRQDQVNQRESLAERRLSLDTRKEHMEELHNEALIRQEDARTRLDELKFQRTNEQSEAVSQAAVALSKLNPKAENFNDQLLELQGRHPLAFTENSNGMSKILIQDVQNLTKQNDKHLDAVLKMAEKYGVDPKAKDIVDSKGNKIGSEYSIEETVKHGIEETEKRRQATLAQAKTEGLKPHELTSANGMLRETFEPPKEVKPLTPAKVMQDGLKESKEKAELVAQAKDETLPISQQADAAKTLSTAYPDKPHYTEEEITAAKDFVSKAPEGYDVGKIKAKYGF